MKFSKVVVPAVSLLVGSAMVATVGAASLKVKTGTFNDTTLPDAAVAVAEWSNGAGINGGEGLVLAKIRPTAEMVAADVDITGFMGKTISKLGFSVRADGDCGAGSPRFNLYTEEAGNTPYFFGCNSSGATNMETKDTVEDEKGVTWLVKEATLAAAGAEGETITDIEIVVDEQGSTVLDNIVVNDQSIGKADTGKKGKGKK